ncbi:IS5 family transposase, partial [Thioclava indica]
AVQACLTLKVLFGLPLWQTVGLVESLIRMAGLDWRVPDYSALCRRQARIGVQIPYRRTGRPLNLLIDSTVVKFCGDGALSGDCFAIPCRVTNGWARKHGPSRRRQWRKVRIAMDTETGDIRAVEFTSSRQGDSPLLPDLLSQIPEGEEIATVTADGAYDTRRCQTAIIEHGADAFGHSFGPMAVMPSLPTRRNGRAWKEDCPAAVARNEILRATRHLGRALWKKWAGYHVRSRIEAYPFMV